ncbi:MAG: class I SAM-dependent RNA methyltransferase [Lachnospiraceae bacterium]|nr:class I SAM-dependent RNA methyltransferase [Lachnospiraceae bacterium]
MAYSKNEMIEVTIEDIGVDGEGIGHIEGYTFFIKDAVIGDTVSAKIMKATKSYAYARLEKVITPSPFRVSPKCDIARSCGGCQIQALSYKKQLEYKQNKVRNNLKRIGGFEDKLLDWISEKIVGMEEPWNYRNKAVYPVGYDKEGKLIAGFYAGRTHSIIAGEECCIGAKGDKDVLDIILGHMEKYDVKPYNEETREGLVRHILLRKGFNSGERMVCIVINRRLGADAYRVKSGKQDKSVSTSRRGDGADNRGNGMWISEKEFIEGQGDLLVALSKIEGMTSVSVNINTENTNVILGKETYCIWGKPYITDTIQVRDMTKPGYPVTGRKLQFHISPQSFYQVNPLQTEKLYSLALQYAALTGREAVWDLYCGIGTISLFLAGNAGKIYGVEVVPQAIEDARDNARRNGIENAKFFVGKAEEVLPQFYSIGEGIKSEKSAGLATGDGEKAADMRHPDVIVVDPPRKGCDEECLRTMVSMAPERIVYVSCDSATLARDLKYLTANGYNLLKVRPVDMFPNTVHVEVCCLLERLRSAKEHIEITIDAEDYYRIKDSQKGV